MRPLNAKENDHSNVWKVLPESSSVTQTTPEGHQLADQTVGRNFFCFDKTFAETSSTQEVYNSVAKGVISSVLDGFNGTIFTYGQTSSGKTYTMQGSGTIQEGALSSGDKGIVHMAASDIFQHIHNTPTRNYQVHVSFLEVYNEEVRDLLSENTETVALREDPRRGVVVKSRNETVKDINGLLEIMFRGERSRKVAATAMNDRSSRSHTIFRITIESCTNVMQKAGNPSFEPDTENNPNGGPSQRSTKFNSTLNLVDLAGSESVKHTGATGDRQKEGSLINQSLLSLSRVIVALGKPNQMHVNYRDSKLTRILQPSLSGNAKMAVICCVTPSQMYLEETRSTLQFAGRAKAVKTRAHVNEVIDDDKAVIRQLRRELAEVKTYHAEQTKVLERKVTAVEVAEAKKAKELNEMLQHESHDRQSLEEAIRELHKERATTIAKFDGEKEMMLRDRNQSDNENARLATENETKNERIADLESKIQRLEGDCNQSDNENARLATENEAKNEHIANLKYKFQRLEDDRNQADNEIARLATENQVKDERIAYLESKIQRLEGDHNQADNEIAQLARANEAKDERIANLESKVQILEGEHQRTLEHLYRSGWERDQLFKMISKQNEQNVTSQAPAELNSTCLDMMMMFSPLDTPKTDEQVRMSMLSFDSPENNYYYTTKDNNDHLSVDDNASPDKLPTRKRRASAASDGEDRPKVSISDISPGSDDNVVKVRTFGAKPNVPGSRQFHEHNKRGDTLWLNCINCNKHAKAKVGTKNLESLLKAKCIQKKEAPNGEEYHVPVWSTRIPPSLFPQRENRLLGLAFSNFLNMNKQKAELHTKECVEIIQKTEFYKSHREIIDTPGFDLEVVDLTQEDEKIDTDNKTEETDVFYENADEFPVIHPEERLPVGTRVYKHFPPYGWFYGTIESLVEGNRLYYIKYTDGDEEILKHEDVLLILADNNNNNNMSKTKNTKQESKRRRTTRKKSNAETKRQSKLLPARKTRSSCCRK